MLKIDNVHFSHAKEAAQYLFQLQLAPGEIVAINGKSGAGKSTLLDLISGFLSPISGQITLNDTNLNAIPPQSRPVSILHQTDNLFDHLSVSANLALGLSANTPKAERHEMIESVLRDVDLAGYGDRPAANLSGGQKQRVALARTLLLKRPILLLDEPFAALDPETATTMRRLVKKLVKAQKWHAIVVSHDPEDMSQLGSRQYRIEDERLIAHV